MQGKRGFASEMELEEGRLPPHPRHPLPKQCKRSSDQPQAALPGIRRRKTGSVAPGYWSIFCLHVPLSHLRDAPGLAVISLSLLLPPAITPQHLHLMIRPRLWIGIDDTRSVSHCSLCWKRRERRDKEEGGAGIQGGRTTRSIHTSFACS